MKRRTVMARRIALSVLGIVLIVVASYLYSRLRSAAVAVSVETVETPAVWSEAGGILKLASYNIAHGRGGRFGATNWDGGNRAEKRRRLEDMGALLAGIGADVVVLNEVDFSAVWSGHDDQAGLIAAAGGYPYVVRQRSFDISIPFVRMVFGNAVLSRYPVAEAWRLVFPPLSRFESLAAGNHDGVVARIRLPDGSLIAVCGVHLEVRSPKLRQEAARRILELASTLEDPLFVLGDFNSMLPRSTSTAPSRESAVSMLVDSGRFRHFPGAHELDRFPTFPSEAPDRVIDWVLFPPDWNLVDGFVRRSPLSDHLPVAAFVSYE